MSVLSLPSGLQMLVSLLVAARLVSEALCIPPAGLLLPVPLFVTCNFIFLLHQFSRLFCLHFLSWYPYKQIFCCHTCYSIPRYSKVLTVDVCGQYLVAQQSHAVSSMKAVQMKPLWNSSEYQMAVCMVHQ